MLPEQQRSRERGGGEGGFEASGGGATGGSRRGGAAAAAVGPETETEIERKGTEMLERISFGNGKELIFLNIFAFGTERNGVFPERTGTARKGSCLKLNVTGNAFGTAATPSPVPPVLRFG